MTLLYRDRRGPVGQPATLEEGAKHSHVLVECRHVSSGDYMQWCPHRHGSSLPGPPGRPARAIGQQLGAALGPQICRVYENEIARVIGCLRFDRMTDRAVDVALVLDNAGLAARIAVEYSRP